MARYRSDYLNEGIENLNLRDPSDEASSDSSYEEDYYIHIDIVQNLIEDKHLVPRQINQFMLEQDCFDPRRAKNFPTDVMGGEDSICRRGKLTRRGKEYYELWKVRKNFDIKAFAEMVREFDKEKVEVHVVRMMGSDHENLTFKGEKIKIEL